MLNPLLQSVGIKGSGVLYAHCPFDLCARMVIDVMHCVFLGVGGKTLMKYLFTLHTMPNHSVLGER